MSAVRGTLRTIPSLTVTSTSSFYTNHWTVDNQVHLPASSVILRTGLNKIIISTEKSVLNNLRLFQNNVVANNLDILMQYYYLQAEQILASNLWNLTHLETERSGIRIREVPSWNLSPETGYPKFFRGFP
jgi:hypothetical protein